MWGIVSLSIERNNTMPFTIRTFLIGSLTCCLAWSALPGHAKNIDPPGQPGVISGEAVTAAVVNDATSGIQKALDAAAEKAKAGTPVGVKLDPNQHYTISQPVELPPGVKFLDGAGAKLTATPSPEMTTMFLIRSRASGVVLANLNLDLAGAPKVTGVTVSAIVPAEAHRDGPEELHNVTVRNVAMRGVATSGIAVHARQGSANNVHLVDNFIEFAGDRKAEPAEGTTGILVTAQPPKGRVDNWQELVTTGKIAPGKYRAEQINISGNRIYGGYYGVSFDGVSNSRITENQLSWNVRNISVQNASHHNEITANNVYQTGSASIHLAYDSDHNTVRDNTVVSTRAWGEGVLQAYQNSNDNVFVGNLVYAYGEKEVPRWALYTASGSRNRFDGNVVSSAPGKTLLAVESLWDGQSAGVDYPGNNPYSYMEVESKSVAPGAPEQSYLGGRGPLQDVAFTGNVLHNAPDKPLAYVGAEVTLGKGGQGPDIGNIEGLRISANQIIGGNKVQPHVGRLDGVGEATISGDHSGGQQHPGQVSATLGGAPTLLVTQAHELAPADPAAARLLGNDPLALTGDARGNQLYGNPADNRLTGGAGADELSGGFGSDQLTGGADADRFVLDGPLGAQQVDQLLDFTSGVDQIVLPRQRFGLLEGDWFAASAEARTPASRVFVSGHELFYDADGSGTLFDPVGFAVLPQGVTLQASDLVAR